MPESIKLRIIPKPLDETIITSNDFPVFVGKNGGFNYHCGFCNTILAEDVEKGQYSNEVVKCTECWRFNKFS